MTTGDIDSQVKLEIEGALSIFSEPPAWFWLIWFIATVTAGVGLVIVF